MIQVLDVCINHGCNNKRASSGAKSKGDKLRPYCGRCHMAVRGKTSYKEGVFPIKKTYCENKDGRLGFICATKGVKLFSCMLDMDHIKPEAQGGLNVPENIQTLCKNCHARKSWEDGDGRIQNPRKNRKLIYS